MSAAPARLAVLDQHTPASELAAHGSVAVNGHADDAMPPTRMGPPRPRVEAPSPALSPARQALAHHLGNLAKLAAEVERKSKPVARLREQLGAAHVELQNAERVLADLDAQHSAAIAEAARVGCCSAEPVESADAEAAVERARRNCNSVRMAMEEVNRDLVQANANLTAADAHFDRLALAILVEEHEAHLLIWAKARDAYHLAEINLIGLLAALGEHGRTLESSAPGAGLVWLRQLEKMQPPWHHLDHGHVERGGPREVSAASGRWSAVLHRLKTDPGATF
jgi:hypothetical protein